MSADVVHSITMGDQGLLVVPPGLRERHGWGPGTPLIVSDTDDGMLVMSVEQGLRLLRCGFEDRDLVRELLDERRAEVERESAEVANGVQIRG